MPTDKYHLTYSSTCTPVTIDEYTVADSQLADGNADAGFNTTHTRRLVKTSNGATPSGGASTTSVANTAANKIIGSASIDSGKHFCTDDTDADITNTGTSIGSDNSQSNAGNDISTGNAIFVGFKIRAVNTTGQTASTVDCLISLDNGATHPIKLTGVGDGCVIPLASINTNTIHIKSSALNKCCFVTILVGKE